MPPQIGGVGKDGVRADHAVMGNVHVGHDPVVVADAGEALVLSRAAVDRDALTKGVAIADLKSGRFAPIFLVLGRAAQRGMRMNDVVPAEDRGPFKDRMGADAAACANLNIGANHRIRPDLHIISQFGAGIDQGCGMNA